MSNMTNFIQLNNINNHGQVTSYYDNAEVVEQEGNETNKKMIQIFKLTVLVAGVTSLGSMILPWTGVCVLSTAAKILIPIVSTHLFLLAALVDFIDQQLSL